MAMACAHTHIIHKLKSNARARALALAARSTQHLAHLACCAHVRFIPDLGDALSKAPAALFMLWEWLGVRTANSAACVRVCVRACMRA
eukprot:12329760-Alexandrium_andersonii.AAC.1